MTVPGFERWLGGSPLGVLARLIFLSLLVGVILAFLGLTPLGLVRHLLDSAQALFHLGYDTIGDIGRYILTGAVIVVPLWLLSRLMSARR
ncbi:DUF6460 domain-containing protein [Enterovirga sp.]|uniref:DUF6460 domain-containing protein n=1 Tax=Enterovirga sp. TaxID=2026350 RepID=UPI003FA55B59